MKDTDPAEPSPEEREYMRLLQERIGGYFFVMFRWPVYERPPLYATRGTICSKN